MDQRKDALIKAMGQAQYTDDLQVGNILYGRPVGVPVSKGILKQIVFDSKFDWKDFVICTAKDLEIENLLPPKPSDEPILLSQQVNYYGQAALLIAHADPKKLREAVKHISFVFDEETPRFGIDITHPDNEVFTSKILSTGDTEKGFRQSDQIIEGVYSTQAQEHLYFETQIIIANFDKQTGILYIEGSMQAPFNVREGILRSFKNRVKDIIVTPHLSGGAFGGREDFTTQVALYASLLALKSNQKIKIKLDRSYDMKFSTKRHPSSTKVKVGIKDNKINSLSVDFLLDAGAFETISDIVLSRSMLHPGSFRSPNILVSGKTVKTNTPPNGAFRGFGAPQTFFAVESHIDHVIRTLNLNEVDFRKNNLMSTEDESLAGQKLGPVGVDKVFADLIERSGYDDLKTQVTEFNKINTYKKMGLGFASVFHGTGYTGYQDIDTPVSINLRKLPDGQIQIESSVIEFGQGSHTILPTIASKILGIPVEKISVSNINTQVTPSSGATVASRTASLLGGLVEKAALKMLNQLNSPEEVVISEVYQREQPFDYQTMQGKAYENYASAAILTLIEVDLITYIASVKDVYISIDAGKIVNESVAEGQVQGGIVQGLGLALLEEMKMGDKGYQNETVSSYNIPTVLETPNIHIHFIEEEKAHAKGLGEIPVVGVAPSIANALEDALKIRFCNLPVTPEKIETALRSN